MIFLPFMLLTGVVGAFFKPLALTMALTLVVSFVVALVIVPVSVSAFVPTREADGKAAQRARAFRDRIASGSAGAAEKSLGAAGRWPDEGILD